MRFELGRGHDGPARNGLLKLGTTELSTPLLLGPSMASLPQILRYHTIGRDRLDPDELHLAVLPSFASNEELESDALRSSELVLLPSMVSIGELGGQARVAAVRLQLGLLSDLVNKLEASRAALRIPYGSRPDELKDPIRDASALGVRSAAIAFSSALGPDDLLSMEVRSVLPRHWFVIATGSITPSMIPLLYYLGFDAFDTSMAGEAAASKLRQWSNGDEEIDDTYGSARFCPCPACSDKNVLSLDVDDLTRVLLRHNETLYMSTLSEAVNAQKRGKLRWLVESTTHSSPATAAALRLVDGRLYSYLEELTPNSGRGTMPLIGHESYESPIVRRFRDRVRDRYLPPETKRLVVLLPCSAKKPYSESKSHHLFREVIDSAAGSVQLHLAETILTSPLGVVPRELERVYPAANYDIPVTGEWDHDEIRIASSALVTHLNKFPSDSVVVAHVSGGYADVVKNAEDHIVQSIVYTSQGGSVTSRESLSSLEETLVDMKGILGLRPGRRTEYEETLRRIADYQFGVGAGMALIPEGSKLNGKLYRMIVCRLKSEQTCAFVAATGSISLTVRGGELLTALGKYTVKFDGESLTGGSLFAIAVDEADPEIRPGDEVIVVNRNDVVIAVGRSEMSGPEMCESDNGRAVSLRHKVG